MSSITNPCPICLEENYSKPLIYTTFCKHIFHRECIVEWINSQRELTQRLSPDFSSISSCPICRERITDQTLKQLDPKNPQIPETCLSQHLDEAVKLMNESKHENNPQNLETHLYLAITFLQKTCQNITSQQQEIAEKLNKAQRPIEEVQNTDTQVKNIFEPVSEKKSHPSEINNQTVRQEVTVNEEAIFMSSESSIFVPPPEKSTPQSTEGTYQLKPTPTIVNSLLNNVETPSQDAEPTQFTSTAWIINRFACLFFVLFLAYYYSN